MVTAASFIEKVKIPLTEQWGYIYGTWGKTWTQALQESYSQPGHKNYEMTARYGKRWIGRKVTDCSGLLRWALAQLGESIVHQARYQYTDYSGPRGKLSAGLREDGTPPLPGSAVFLQGKESKIHHVGVYVGGDICIEAKGTAYGVVISHLSHWDHWGELKMVDYTGAAALEKDPPVLHDDDAEAGTVLTAVVSNPQTWLNVRANAGSQYPVVFQVQKGTEVEILDAGSPDWWQIRYGGRIGWAYAQYLKISGLADTDQEPEPEADPEPPAAPQEPEPSPLGKVDAPEGQTDEVDPVPPEALPAAAAPLIESAIRSLVRLRDLLPAIDAAIQTLTAMLDEYDPRPPAREE